jgi:hypothetical protein
VKLFNLESIKFRVKVNCSKQEFDWFVSRRNLRMNFYCWDFKSV